MILGDKAIKERIVPYLNTHGTVNPASVNVRLGNTLLIPKRKLFGIAIGDQIQYKRIELRESETYHLKPGRFILGCTKEVIHTPEDIAFHVDGRSSIGRIGLFIQNAGYVDPGFYGSITLEIYNASPNTIILHPGYEIGQFVFQEVSEVENPYSGKYNGQIEAAGSRMHMDKLEQRYSFYAE